MAWERFSLEGRVAVVSGGGTGIGRGTALVLAEHGADIVLAGRRVDLLERVAGEIEALGRRALPVRTDVTDAAQCDGWCRQLDGLGRLDVLVNNAGGAMPKPPMEWSVEEWHEVLEVNLTSVWYLSRGAAKPMLEQGKGAIVNISSGASLLALPNAAPYGAAKAGVNNLTGALSAAWTPAIRINAIAVGASPPRCPSRRRGCTGSTKQTIGARNGMGRVGQPDEIGHTVLFLASDAASFLSGQTIWVNGGPQAPAYP